MPTYDYGCHECGHHAEIFKSISESESEEKCPECESVMDKLISKGTSFQISGYCYDNVYGKKNWKKHLSQDEQAKVLQGKRSPY